MLLCGNGLSEVKAQQGFGGELSAEMQQLLVIRLSPSSRRRNREPLVESRPYSNHIEPTAKEYWKFSLPQRQASLSMSLIMLPRMISLQLDSEDNF